MKYKQTICIFVVSIFLFTICSAAARPISDREFGKMVEDSGTINIEKMGDKEVYYIDADNGITIMGKHFDRYIPLNLDKFGEEFQQEGIHVKFSGVIAISSITFPMMMKCYRYSALPIILESISQTSNDRPVAEFKWEPKKPETTEEVMFTDLSKDDKAIVAWKWDFGDKQTSEEQNPVHVYAEPRLYKVTLTVKDEDGGLDSISHTILVTDGDPDGKISIVYGVVTDIMGKPVADAKVGIYQGSSHFKPIKGTTTDEKGNYKLGVEKPGNYMVGAYKPGCGMAKAEVKITEEPLAIEVNLELKPFWF